MAGEPLDANIGYFLQDNSCLTYRYGAARMIQNEFLPDFDTIFHNWCKVYSWTKRYEELHEKLEASKCVETKQYPCQTQQDNLDTNELYCQEFQELGPNYA